MQKDVKKLYDEIKNVDSWIKKEKDENEYLIYFLNFFNMNNEE